MVYYYLLVYFVVDKYIDIYFVNLIKIFVIEVFEILIKMVMVF